MTALLEVSGLVKRFGGFAAVDGVSFTVAAGSIHAVIGPNGAGKTTLFRLLTGFHLPTAGRIRLEGRDIAGLSPHRIARLGLAQSFQITTVFPRLTVREQVAFALVAQSGLAWHMWGGLTRVLGRRGVLAEADTLLEEVGLAAVAARPAETLSHGDQRALDVALALATRPRLLLLDEPTAGMSPFETERMVAMIQRLARARGLSVLFSEHDMDVVFGISDRITVIHRGRVIAEGDAAAVQADPEVAEVYLGSAA
jgi:branched-chain amino acid transport system ATP-binding protein